MNHGRRGAARGKQYIELELNRKTLRQIEVLAREQGCTAFDMSVILLREGLSTAARASVP